VPAKGGPKLLESKGPRTYFTARPGLIEGKQRSMAELTRALAGMLSAPVSNQSSLEAMYDIKLQWTPDMSPDRPAPADTLTTEILSLERNGQTRVVPPACENRVAAAIDKLAVPKPRVSRRIMALDRQPQC